MAANDVNIRIRAIDDTDKGFRSVKSSLGGLRSAVFSVQGAISGLITGVIIKDTIALADAYTSVTARLRLVSSSTQEFTAVQKALFATAQNTRSSFEQTVDLYSSLRRSTIDLGVSQEKLVELTGGIGKALAISGAKGASAEAALIQLGQGFAAGALRGQEFMSVAEQAPAILDVLSKGLGKTRGELKKMADEGLITTTVFIEGFTAGSKNLERQFQTLPVTVDGSMTRIKNAIMTTVGSMDQLLGATSKLAKAFSSVAKGIEFLNVDGAKGRTELAKYASELINAKDALDEFNNRISLYGKNEELTNGLAKAQERYNKALFAFRGKDIDSLPMSPLISLPKAKLATPETKEAKKAREAYAKQLADQRAELASLMTVEETRARKGIAEMYRLRDATNESGQAFRNSYAEAKKLRDNVGGAEMIAIRETVEAMKTPLEQFADGIKTVEDSMQDIALGGLMKLEDGLVGLINGTKSASDAFRDMASSIINDMIRMVIQRQITAPLAGALNNVIGAAFGGAAVPASPRAIGGSVQSGRTHLVGERGPELFIPSASGSIVPNNAMGGGGVTVVQNINVSTGVQQTVRAEIMTLMPQIANAAKSAVAEAKLRGGSFGAALR